MLLSFKADLPEKKETNNTTRTCIAYTLDRIRDIMANIIVFIEKLHSLAFTICHNGFPNSLSLFKYLFNKYIQ